MEGIENIFRTKGVPIFAKFDHGKNTEEVGLKTSP